MASKSPTIKHNILFVTPGFAASETDTASVTYFLNYVLELKATQPESKITVITLDYPFEKRDYLWHGIKVRGYGLYKTNKLKKLISFRKIAKQLIKEHRQTPFTVIHSLWLKQASLLGLYLSRKMGIPCIMTAMGMEFVMQNRYLKIFNKQSSTVINVSERQAIDSPYQDTQVIPWGVSRQQELSPDRPIDLLFVGFLNKNKNISLALDIFAVLIKSRPNLKIKIIGDYFNVDQWRQSSVEMNLQDNIEFTGRINNTEVLNTMRTAKVLIHTSSYESLGYAMLEAISCGMYVVSKEVGIAGISDNWLIVNSKDEFIDTIKNLLTNYKYPGPDLPIPIEETVKQYIALYSKSSI